MRDSLEEKPLKNAHLTICLSKTFLTSGGFERPPFSPPFTSLVGCEKTTNGQKKKKGKKKVEEEEGREFPGAVAFLSLVKF